MTKRTLADVRKQGDEMELSAAIPVFVEISRHLQESNTKQIELIMETSSLRATVERSNARMGWMTVVLMMVFAAMVIQLTRQELSISRLRAAENSIKQASMKQADVEAKQVKGIAEMKKTSASLQAARKAITELTGELPKVKVDGFGRVFLEVAIANEAAANKLRRAQGRVKPIINPDATRASLPIARGRIQYQ